MRKQEIYNSNSYLTEFKNEAWVLKRKRFLFYYFLLTSIFYHLGYKVEKDQECYLWMGGQ